MKTLLKILLFFAAFGLAVAPLASHAQTSACQYSTCVPVKQFNNLDLMQIYGAIVRNGPFTGTISISTVTVANTVTMTGNVGGITSTPQSTLTADGSYTASFNVGGTQSVTVFRSGHPSGMLSSVSIWDLGNQKASLTLDFYTAAPSGTFTNGAPQVMTDPTKYIGSVNIAQTDYVSTGTVARASVTGINLPIAVVSGTAIYYTVTVNGNPTYGVNQTLYFRFGVLQD